MGITKLGRVAVLALAMATQTATEGPGYFESDYAEDALNKHCTAS